MQRVMRSFASIGLALLTWTASLSARPTLAQGEALLFYVSTKAGDRYHEARLKDDDDNQFSDVIAGKVAP